MRDVGSAPASSSDILRFDFRLLRVPTFDGGLAAAFAISASLFSRLTYLVLYMQTLLGVGRSLRTTCERVVRPGTDDRNRWTKRARVARGLRLLLVVLSRRRCRVCRRARFRGKSSTLVGSDDGASTMSR
jgi:hypothetical protein